MYVGTWTQDSLALLSLSLDLGPIIKEKNGDPGLGSKCNKIWRTFRRGLNRFFVSPLLGSLVESQYAHMDLSRSCQSLLSRGPCVKRLYSTVHISVIYIMLRHCSLSGTSFVCRIMFSELSTVLNAEKLRSGFVEVTPDINTPSYSIQSEVF